LSYFPRCFCWSLTAELLRTQLSAGNATSICNTGSVATTYKAILVTLKWWNLQAGTKKTSIDI